MLEGAIFNYDLDIQLNTCIFLKWNSSEIHGLRMMQASYFLVLGIKGHQIKSNNAELVTWCVITFQ